MKCRLQSGAHVSDDFDHDLLLNWLGVLAWHNVA